MRLPIQSAPVQRPEVIAPHSVVHLEGGRPDYLFSLFVNGLIHGGNFNDPVAWQLPTYQQLKTF